MGQGENAEAIVGAARDGGDVPLVLDDDARVAAGAVGTALSFGSDSIAVESAGGVRERDVARVVDLDAGIAVGAVGVPIGSAVDSGLGGNIDIAGILDRDAGIAVGAVGVSPDGGKNAEHARLKIAFIVDGDAGVAVGAVRVA